MKQVIAAIVFLLIAAPVIGQQNLDELMDKVRQQRLELGNASQQQAPVSEGTLEDRAAKTQTALEAAKRRSDQLNARFEANQRAVAEMADKLRVETGDLSELFAVIRQYAGDTAGALKSSLVSAQLGDRSGLPVSLARPGNIPSPEQLHEFHELMLGELIQSGRVARFSREIVDAAGVPAMAEIVRVGTFNLVSDDKFLRYEVGNGTVQELARQPAQRYRNDANALFNAASGIAPMAIDPTAGQLLALLIQTPDAKERINQGGLVGYIIIALGVIGLLIGVYRLFYLGAAGTRINNQLKSDTPDESNALGRILSVYDKNATVNTETLELMLDEAIIKETPELEKWQAALKVIAAVAPLLGLLGTVIGMIETFQQITLSGTSDPRLMAAGISKALVTTMLGLLVAIPIVLIHSMVASRSKYLIEVLEEQSAAIIAKQAEKRQ